MLASEMTEVNGDVLDAVGELTNIIAGQAKAQLEQYDLRVSLPNVVTGDDHRLHLPPTWPPSACRSTAHGALSRLWLVSSRCKNRFTRRNVAL